jgi:hypothetical protein
MRVAEKKKKKKKKKKDQGAAIDLDNNSELSKILSFEIDGIYIDSISNSEGATARVMIVAMF